MSSTIKILIATSALALPLAAQARGGDRLSDMSYCAALSEKYVRYVGRSESGPRTNVQPNVDGGGALAKCRQGDTATAIPMLERKLTNAKVELPGRS